MADRVRAEKDATELVGLVDMLAKVQADIKSLREQEDALKLTLSTYLGDAEVGLVAGKPAYTYTKSWPRKFDQKTFARENPETYEQYRVEREQRTFNLVGSDE